MMDWQPIETAPRDGTEILVWNFEEDHNIAFWSMLHSIWYGLMGTPVKPSHWMPLPPKPETL